MKLMVLDGNSIVNRAFYGVRLLSTKDGLYTNAVFGFLNILQKLLSEENPDGLCVTFDLKAPTFRHLKYEGYKAQRKKMPEELAVQMPVLKEVLEAMNIPYYQLEGYEADDLIGTISARDEEQKVETVIVTGDKDSFQLIDERTYVRHVKSRMGQTETKLYNNETFFEEYGFEPKKIIDLKALMGDSSDNIPGVAGIGEKTAMQLIRTFGTIENLYENIDSADIKDSVRKKLSAGEESARMSYELATIVRDAPIDFSAEENLIKEPDNDRLYSVFKKLEFNRMIERYGLTPPDGTSEQEKTVTAVIESRDILSPEDLKSALDYLAGAEFTACAENEDFTVISLVNGCSVYNISADNFEGDYGEAVHLIYTCDIKRCGHNVKNTLRRLLDRGIEGSFYFDTAIAAYLLDPTANSYELGRLAEYYCGFEMILPGDENGQMSLLDEHRETVEIMQNAEGVYLLHEALLGRIKEQGMEKLLFEIEMPLCPVLADMEHCGITADRKALADFGAMLSENIKNLESGIYALAGETFNINSPKQLGCVLFDKLLLPAPKKTKTGYSTNADVLEKLKNKHPIIELILEYRQLSKLKSTYADGLLKFIDDTGKIHTTFQNTVTATGRLSSTDPNLQNIPVRTDLGEEIRKMFVAGEGNVLVDADYSQIELRLLAHISGDETMREAFLSGEDFHKVTASQVFGVPVAEVTNHMRSSAKAVNFGIVYGISQFSLSQDIGVSVAEAKEYMDRYFERFSGVHKYMKDVVKKAGEDGYVSTLYGRRRYLPELKSSNFNIRSFGERVALNMPIQGTAADIMKIAMIKTYGALKDAGLRAKLLLQIHDEMIVECPEEEKDIVVDIMCSQMKAAATLSVPLIADAGWGRSWYEAK